MTTSPPRSAEQIVYRLEPRDEAGLILGLSALQGLALGSGLVAGVLLLTAGLPIAIPAVVTLMAAAGGLGRRHGRPLVDWAALAVTALARRRHRHWRRDLFEAGDAPPSLRHLRLLTLPAEDAAIGAVLDAQFGTLTALVPVTGTEFLLQDAPDQHHLLARWGDLLGQFATPGQAVSHLCWSDIAEPSGITEHRAWLATEGHLREGAPSESYRELLALVPSRALAHRVVLAVTVARQRLPRQQRHGPLAALHLERALLRSLDAVQQGLRNADLHPHRPLNATALLVHVQTGTRSQSTDSRHGAATRPGDAFVATDASWDHYRVDGRWHRTWWIRDWPRQPVAAAWLAPLLGSIGGGERRFTVVFEPVPSSQSRHRIERDLVRLESDAITREEKGRRVDARHRRATQALLDLEEEIVAGHPELAFVGLITLTASSEEELERLGDELEQTAHGHGLDLQVLYARQPEAWAATLAIGICPSRTWG
jgi:hypothetical protein